MKIHYKQRQFFRINDSFLHQPINNKQHPKPILIVTIKIPISNNNIDNNKNKKNKKRQTKPTSIATTPPINDSDSVLQKFVQNYQVLKICSNPRKNKRPRLTLPVEVDGPTQVEADELKQVNAKIFSNSDKRKRSRIYIYKYKYRKFSAEE